MRLILAIILVLCLVDSGLCCGKKRKKGQQGPQQPQQPEACNSVQCVLGDGVTTEPYAPGGDDAGDCSQLKCDSGESCKWSNNKPPADQLNWAKAGGKPDDAKWKTAFNTDTEPEGGYLLTYSANPGTADQSAQLYSAPISCANGDITVKAKHWATEGTKLQVCSTTDPASEPQNCQDLPSGNNGNEDSVTIPKGENQRIVIQAKGFANALGKDAAAVSNIDVTCDPCAGTTAPTEAPPPGETPAPAGNPPCKEIVCDFESGQPCAYTPANAGGGGEGDGSWGVKQGRFKNRLTGVPKAAPDGGQKYGAVYAKKKGDKSSLTTKATFDKGYVVKYEYYKATEGLVLKGCCNDESNCPVQTDAKAQTSQYRSWNQGAFACPAGTTQVIFVCENTGGCEGGGGKHHREKRDGQSGGCEGACGIDNIQLLEGSDPNSATPVCDKSSGGGGGGATSPAPSKRS